MRPRHWRVFSKRIGSLCDSPIRRFHEVLAAGAHLDRNIAQRSAVEAQSRGFPMFRTPEIAELAQGAPFEFLHRAWRIGKQKSFYQEFVL
jgi:hypothetical protein